MTVLDDTQLNEIPGFYTNTGGIGSVTRLGSGINITSNGLPIAKTMEFEFNVPLTTYVDHTEYHDLGYVPYILGTFYFKDSGLRRVFGDFLNPSLFLPGYCFIKNVDVGSVTIEVFAEDGTFGAVLTEDTIVVKLYFIAQSII